MWNPFESRHRREKDASDIRRLYDEHGEEVVDVLRARVQDSKGSERDHRHWRRLLRKAKRHRRHYRAQKRNSAK